MMQLVMRRKNWLRDELGPVGLVSIGLLALALALLHFVVRPLEERNDALRRDVERAEGEAGSPDRVRASSPSAQLAAFHKFLATGEGPAEWLARLDSIATEAGLKLGAGDYRLNRAGARLDRYEVTLPLSGSYAQVRVFLENALSRIPAMSLDQVSFRRENANDPRVEAQARLTFHSVQP